MDEEREEMQGKTMLNVWALVAAAMTVCTENDNVRLEDGDKLVIALDLLREAERLINLGMSIGRWE